MIDSDLIEGTTKVGVGTFFVDLWLCLGFGALCEEFSSVYEFLLLLLLAFPVHNL